MHSITVFGCNNPREELAGHLDIGLALPLSAQPVSITEADFNQYVDNLTGQSQELTQLRARGVNIWISRMTTIQEWSYVDVDSADSSLTVVYGTDQYVQPMFHLHDVEHYQSIKTIIKDTIGIRMNDKHVRPKGVLD